MEYGERRRGPQFLSKMAAWDTAKAHLPYRQGSRMPDQSTVLVEAQHFGRDLLDMEGRLLGRNELLYNP